MPAPTVPLLFDAALLRLRRARAAGLGRAAFLLDRVQADMAERLHATVRDFPAIGDVWTPGAARAALPPGDARFGALRSLAAPDSTDERLAFAPGSLDLVVSALALQFANDLPGVFAQVRRALKPDGLFLAAMVGGETLTELRQAFAAAEAEIEGGASPRVAPFIDLRDAGALLQRAGFALPVTDVDRIVVRYDHAIALMHDLRRMAATNALAERSRKPTRRATLVRCVEIYAERFADADGRIRATFDIVWLSGWAPHDSQQTPLKPGSATARLEDAVKGRRSEP
jgi:SAM-dependent methyltransferase